MSTSAQRILSSLDAPLRTDRFRKDPFVEEALDVINDGLPRAQAWMEKHTAVERLPVVLICGVPRSGTTLAVQLLASRLHVGYCSNLMARFYNAPAVGALLQRELLADRIHDLREFRSVHGVTLRAEEPNEFGYFWSRHLSVADRVHEPTEERLGTLNLERLNTELTAVTGVFGRPMVLKCMLGVFFLRALAQIPKTLFVYVERDALDVAISIYKTREERLGSASRWWSFRPRVYEEVLDSPPANQVAAQIASITAAAEAGMSRIPEDRLIRVNYADLARDPESFVDVVVGRLSTLGCEVPKRGEPLNPLPLSQGSAPKDLTQKLSSALAHYNVI